MVSRTFIQENYPTAQVTLSSNTEVIVTEYKKFVETYGNQVYPMLNKHLEHYNFCETLKNMVKSISII